MNGEVDVFMRNIQESANRQNGFGTAGTIGRVRFVVKRSLKSTYKKGSQCVLMIDGRNKLVLEAIKGKNESNIDLTLGLHQVDVKVYDTDDVYRTTELFSHTPISFIVNPDDMVIVSVKLKKEKVEFVAENKSVTTM